MMITGIIVQSRMGSKRLPGKAMMPLAGKPLLYRLIERLKRVKSADRIVVAIPDTAENDVLLPVIEESGVSVFRGSESNLLDRHIQAAEKFSIEVIVRFPGDNPVPEPSEIERIIGHYQSKKSDFCTNICSVFDNNYPDGIGAEVFSLKKLKELSVSEKNPEKLEHVHLNFFNYKTQKPVNAVTVSTVECPPEFARPEIVLDVNTIEQYRFMSQIYEALYPGKHDFSIVDILSFLDSQQC